MPAVGSTRIDDSSASGIGIVKEESTTISVDPDEQSILSASVPTDKIWRLRYAEIACRGFGRWQIKADGARIGGGLTGPATEHDRTDFPEFMDIASGKTVEMLYLYTHGPDAISIDAFLGIVEI